jgi:peptidyl-prolyl cis-trans isomerase B (cyclophilin B)
MEPGLKQKPTRKAIANEATNGRQEPQVLGGDGRATPYRTRRRAQFFINTADNDFLDYKAPSANGWGYCVFAKVVEGRDVVDKIGKVATDNNGGHQNVPKEDVVIHKAVESA